MPKADGWTLRKELELMSKKLGKTHKLLEEEIQPPIGTEYIFEMFFDINKTRQADSPLTHEMIINYSLLNNWCWDCLEIEILYALDEVLFTHIKEQQEIEAKRNKNGR